MEHFTEVLPFKPLSLRTPAAGKNMDSCFCLMYGIISIIMVIMIDAGGKRC